MWNRERSLDQTGIYLIEVEMVLLPFPLKVCKNQVIIYWIPCNQIVNDEWESGDTQIILAWQFTL
jgi:hypothetical protein